MEAAVSSAKEAFKSWSKTSPLTRQQIMFKYQNIIKSNMVIIILFIYLYFDFYELYSTKSVL